MSLQKKIPSTKEQSDNNGERRNLDGVFHDENNTLQSIE